MNELPIKSGMTLGLIPARGGSKSIPLKNMADLGGRPLIFYVIAAAKAAGTVLDGLVCSTDHPKIANFCRTHGVDVDSRPKALAGDKVAIPDVIREFLERRVRIKGDAPEMIALLQPTSPFITPDHIRRLVALLEAHPEADSAQTYASLPHNFHAFNQRTITPDGQVAFYFREERKLAFNKQLKPKFYRFGNLLVFRSQSVWVGKDCFGEQSVGFKVGEPYAQDVDGPKDFAYADYLMETGAVELPHLAAYDACG